MTDRYEGVNRVRGSRPVFVPRPDQPRAMRMAVDDALFYRHKMFVYRVLDDQGCPRWVATNKPKAEYGRPFRGAIPLPPRKDHP